MKLHEHPRRSPAALLVLPATALGLLSPLGLARANNEPCRRTEFQFEAVEKACQRGGEKAAKRLMKKAVMRAKDDGKDWRCSTCHENQKTFELTDEGRELNISAYF